MAKVAQGVRDQLEPWVVGAENDLGEVRAYCPLCEEPGASTTPSSSINFKTGLFQCFSGCGGMSVKDLVTMLVQDGTLKSSRPSPAATTAGETEEPAAKLPTENMIQSFVDRLLGSAGYLRVMREKRGLTAETIKEFDLGYVDGRYTIPVRDAKGTLVNVRRYKPDATEPKDKMMSWTRGAGSRRLFLPEVLAGDEIILVEGEMDAIIGQQYGLPTMSHTAGATAWDPKWNLEFEGKTVFICYDCDDAGNRGARKVEGQLSRYASAVHVIHLPLKQKGADLTDYFVEQSYTAEDFRALMEAARAKVTKSAHLGRVRSQEPKRVTLERSMDGRYHEVPLAFTATVAGKVQPPYMIPRLVELNCNEGGGTRCARCPISGRNHLEVEISEHDPLVLELINKNTAASRGEILKHSGIPHTCPDVQIDEQAVYSVEELICVPPADEQRGSANTVDRRIYNVGKFDTPVNTKIAFEGVNTTDKTNRRAVLQTWASEQTNTNLEEFQMTPELRKQLRVFQPTRGQTPIQKFMEIVWDLEANVTRIYGREELHLAYDLVWHSVSDFTFRKVLLGKGWLELLVVGDTRTGKSEAAGKLCDHYRSGVLTTCEGATFAGLVGGAQQMANTWMVSWGTIPLNDRRLVVLDEFGGIAGKGIIEQMSSVRSSGIAQINKIVSQQTSARTRLVWIANPADGRKIDELAGGAIDAFKGLAANPEDVARFDFAIAVASNEVDSSVINAEDPPHVDHVYTQELCSQLVCWAWSRAPEQVVFDEGVEVFILDRAQLIGKRYIPEPPLVQAENVRLKLARMAVALAARLFSTDKTGELVVVKQEHVVAAEKLMDRFYKMPSLGYADHSKKVIKNRAKAAANAEYVEEYLRQRKDDVLVALESCKGSDFRLRDFQEFAGMSQLDAQEAVRTLQQYRMIRRMTKGYVRMEPALVTILTKLDLEGGD